MKSSLSLKKEVFVLRFPRGLATEDLVESYKDVEIQNSQKLQ